MFRKYIKKIQVPLKSDKNNGYFIWSPIFFPPMPPNILSDFVVSPTPAVAEV